MPSQTNSRGCSVKSFADSTVTANSRCVDSTQGSVLGDGTKDADPTNMKNSEKSEK